MIDRVLTRVQQRHAPSWKNEDGARGSNNAALFTFYTVVSMLVLGALPIASQAHSLNAGPVGCDTPDEQNTIALVSAERLDELFNAQAIRTLIERPVSINERQADSPSALVSSNMLVSANGKSWSMLLGMSREDYGNLLLKLLPPN